MRHPLALGVDASRRDKKARPKQKYAANISQRRKGRSKKQKLAAERSPGGPWGPPGRASCEFLFNALRPFRLGNGAEYFCQGRLRAAILEIPTHPWLGLLRLPGRPAFTQKPPHLGGKGVGKIIVGRGGAVMPDSQTPPYQDYGPPPMVTQNQAKIGSFWGKKRPKFFFRGPSPPGPPYFYTFLE